MIVRTIRIFVKPEWVEEFIQATVRNHRHSIQEPGILRFDVLRSGEDSNQFLLYEVYKDDAAISAHRETAHYDEWRQKAESMMAKPRQREAFEVVAPEDPAQW